MPPTTRTKTGSLPQPDKPRHDSGFTYQDTTQRKPKLRHARKDTMRISMPENFNLNAEMARWNAPHDIPRFTIDLSLPPEQRYAEVCAAFHGDMRRLRSLFDELMGDFLPWLPSAVMRWVCWTLLWRVHDEEENRELQVGRWSISWLRRSTWLWRRVVTNCDNVGN